MYANMPNKKRDSYKYPINLIRLILALACLVFLPSCGGEKDSTIAITPTPDNPQALTEAQIRALMAAEDYSPPGTVPTADTDTIAPPGQASNPDGTGYEVGRINIYAKDGVSFDQMKQYIESNGWKLIGHLRGDNSFAVDLQGTISEMAAIDLAGKSPLIFFSKAQSLNNKFGSISNDTYYKDNSKSERNLESINAPNAWKLLEGNNTIINVGVLDSGFKYTHEDVQFSSISTYSGLVDRNKEPFPCIPGVACNHGMLVSGILGATRNNEIGIAGVASNSINLHAYRTDPSNDNNLSRGFISLASQKVRVINYSMWSSKCDQDTKICQSIDKFLDEERISRTTQNEGLEKYIRLTRASAYNIVNKNKDILFVQISGNDGDKTWSGTNIKFTSEYAGLFASGSSIIGASTEIEKEIANTIRNQTLIVGAYSVDESTGAKSIASFTQLPSSTSDIDYPFILAPGVHIQSTLYKYKKDKDNGDIKYDSDETTGTSFAAPHVTGVAALVLKANPLFTPKEVRDIILDSANGEDGLPFNKNKKYSNGNYRYLNSEAAVSLAIDREKCGTVAPPTISNALGNPILFPTTNESVIFTSLVGPRASYSYTGYTWNFSDGSDPIFTGEPKISHTFSKNGSVNVAITPYIRSIKCPTVQTSIIIATDTSPKISSITPLNANLGTTTTFTITGSNLKNGMGFTVEDCDPSNNELPGGTETQRQYQCRFLGSGGTKHGTIKKVPGNNDADNIVYNFDVGVSNLENYLIEMSQSSLNSIGANFSGKYQFISGLNGRPAIKFFGVAEPGMIVIPNRTEIQFSDGATFDMWVRLDGNKGMTGSQQISTSNWVMALLAKATDQDGVAIFTSNTNSSISETGYGWSSWSSFDSSWNGQCQMINPIPGAKIGDWFRVTVTASATEGTSTYFNKKLVHTCPNARPNFSIMNTKNLSVGQFRSFDTNWYTLDGAIQDVRVYKKSLKPAEVSSLQ